MNYLLTGSYQCFSYISVGLFVCSKPFCNEVPEPDAMPIYGSMPCKSLEVHESGYQDVHVDVTK